MSGHEVREVYAMGANRGADFFADAGDVDAAAAVMTLDDGTFALVVGDPLQRPRLRRAARGPRSRDSVAVGLDDRLPLRSVEPGVSLPGGTPYPAFMERFHDAYVAELTAFTESSPAPAGRSPARSRTPWRPSTSPRPAELVRAEHRPVSLEEVRR